MCVHWVGAQHDVLEEEGEIHTAGLVAPTLCEEGEGEDGEGVSAAPSASLVIVAVGAQASHLLSWAWRDKKHNQSVFSDTKQGSW